MPHLGAAAASHAFNARTSLGAKGLEGSKQMVERPFFPWRRSAACCKCSTQWMGSRRPAAESAPGHGALMTALLYILEQALLDGQGLWSLSIPAPWRDLSWGVFLPLSFVANVVAAILAWIIVGLIMPS